MQTIRYHHNPVTGQAYYDPVDYTQALVEEMVEGRAMSDLMTEQECRAKACGCLTEQECRAKAYHHE
jgi:hypothetical protein